MRILLLKNKMENYTSVTLTVSEERGAAAKHASGMLGSINRDKEATIPLYSALVRPQPEHCVKFCFTKTAVQKICGQAERTVFFQR